MRGFVSRLPIRLTTHAELRFWYLRARKYQARRAEGFRFRWSVC